MFDEDGNPVTIEAIKVEVTELPHKIDSTMDEEDLWRE